MDPQQFSPDWVSAPGDTIIDILREKGLSVADFARKMGQTPDDARDLLQGRTAITINIARRLERALGASVEFWVSRDFLYRQDIARTHVDEQEWLSELPVGDMIKFGWLAPVPHPSEEVEACLRFFDVPDVTAWHRAYGRIQQMVAFRTSPSFDSRPASVAAWLRQGEILSKAIECNSWDSKQFEGSLSAIRSLTREKDPSHFVSELQRRCAQAGVAVAVIRTPSGCRASGATRFVSRDKALLQLSFRYLSDDQFWFSFFHEAGHLLLHGEKGIFLEGPDTPSTAEEQQADEFAARNLVPPAFQPALLNLRADSREIIRFARRVGVSPGIVVGQLQHYRKVKLSHFNRLKRRFKWED